MAKDLLLEIGLEEVPARFMAAAAKQLEEKATKWLADQQVQYGELRSFATPRRLAVLVSGVAEKQEDVHEQVKGPAKKIAVDAEGSWSKAALGFARSQGVEPEQLYFKDLQGVEYVYADKSSIGQPVLDMLPEGLLGIMKSLHFPKNMRWGSYDVKFVRPIRWLVALWEDEVIPMEIAGVSSGRVSRGHRFLGDEVTIHQASSYEALLKEQFVFADPEERRKLIVDQLQHMAEQNNWNIDIQEDLLEEVELA